jgi:hypothetical protein
MQLESAVRAGRELYEQHQSEIESLRWELRNAGTDATPTGSDRRPGRPTHAEVRVSGEATRRQKEELQAELERQREIAREARRLLDGTAGSVTSVRAAELLDSIEAGAAQRPAAEQFLFLVGCPRSGTTAVVELLNGDYRIALGLERFKYLKGRLRRSHFSREYFLNPTPDETNVPSPKLYRELAAKLDRGEVVYLGDKVLTHGDESIYKSLDREFPGCRFLYMFRPLEGVASSFNRRAANPDDVNWPESYDYRSAVEIWNESLAALRSFVERPEAADRVLVVGYEQLFSGEIDSLRTIYDFLGLDLGPGMEKRFAEATRDWEMHAAVAEQLDDVTRRYLDEHRDGELERVVAALAKPGLVAG